MSKEAVKNGYKKSLFLKSFVVILVSSLSTFIFTQTASAASKTQALEQLQNLVNDPSEARKMRRKIINASIKERAQYDELGTLLVKEINVVSSSLPRRIDKYTTLDAAAISGNNIAFKYTLSDSMVGIENKAEVMSAMNKMLKEGSCTSPSGAWLILGYTWSYLYYRESGSYYGGVIIDAEKCGFEQR